MKKLMIVLFISYATIAFADEPKITETDTGVTVEYTGTPSEKDHASEKTATIGRDDYVSRVKYLAAQIEQLEKEIDDILHLSGKETEADLAKKTALVDKKKQQIELYTGEIRRITARDQQQLTEKARPDALLPLNQPNMRSEKKKQIRELKSLRGVSPFPPVPE